MLVFIVCAFISLTLATPEKKFYSLEEGPELFKTFINEYNKQYVGKEKEKRLQIFLDNLKEINSLNEKSSNAVFGITKFSDLTKNEFIQTYTGVKVDTNLINKENGDQVLERFNFTAPNEFDWRSKGVVSRVKDQGHCGSCWAFSVTGNVESMNAIKIGRIVEISEQQLVDCVEVSSKCSGGSPDFAFDYLIRKGAMSSESYPYKAKNGSCHFDSKDVVIHLKKYKHIIFPEQNYKEMLFKTGPLSIAIDADVLMHYNGGIIVKGCPANQINHAVLLVGYGQELPKILVYSGSRTAFFSFAETVFRNAARRDSTSHLSIQGTEVNAQIQTISPANPNPNTKTFHQLLSYGEKSNPGIRIRRLVLYMDFNQKRLEKSVDYWIVKNSWGESLGEKGYFKMKRGVNCLNITKFGVLHAIS